MQPTIAIPDLLSVCTQAARAGADAIRQASTQPREITRKGFRDYVTNADFAAQAAILDVIRQNYPYHAALTEESAEARDIDHWKIPPGYWWIIDPLDGTTNFSYGNPIYCVSVAVAQGDRLLAGVLIDPSREHVFAAGYGLGATLNSQPLHSGSQSALIDAVASCDWPRDADLRRKALDLAGKLGDACRTFRSMGSAALGIAYVGAGWTDMYVHVNMSPWDCAAAVVIATEAGATVTRFDGSAWGLLDKDMIVANPTLCRLASALISGQAG